VHGIIDLALLLMLMVLLPPWMTLRCLSFTNKNSRCTYWSMLMTLLCSVPLHRQLIGWCLDFVSSMLSRTWGFFIIFLVLRLLVSSKACHLLSANMYLISLVVLVCSSVSQQQLQCPPAIVFVLLMGIP